MSKWCKLMFRSGAPEFPGVVSRKQLNLYFTFANGQCFGWRKTDPGNVWTGVIGNQVAQVRQADDEQGTVEFRCVSSVSKPIVERVEQELYDFFQLGSSLTLLNKRWATSRSEFAQIFDALYGMRILRQDPTECLFSFICSSNNHITRIEKMVNSLRSRYGKVIGTLEPVKVSGEALQFFSFPSIQSLAKAQEHELRELGFGYRANYIVESATILSAKQNGGDDWLKALRDNRDQQFVQDALTELKGVGKKVADCVALFSLDQPNCIPVDTHVFQIAQRDLDHKLRKVKSVTPAIYKQVGDLFVAEFGDHAGWAHQVLFAAELPHFNSYLSKELQQKKKTQMKERAVQNKKERETKARKKSEPKVPKKSETKVPMKSETKTLKKSETKVETKSETKVHMKSEIKTRKKSEMVALPRKKVKLEEKSDPTTEFLLRDQMPLDKKGNSNKITTLSDVKPQATFGLRRSPRNHQ